MLPRLTRAQGLATFQALGVGKRTLRLIEFPTTKLHANLQRLEVASQSSEVWIYNSFVLGTVTLQLMFHGAFGAYSMRGNGNAHSVGLRVFVRIDEWLFI